MLISWLSVLLILSTVSIWPLRIICTASRKGNNGAVYKIWNLLRKLHIPMGILATVGVCLHCQNVKQQSLQNSPLGSFLLLCLLALISTGLSKKILPRIWLRLHKIIALILLFGIFIHCFIEF